MRLLLLCVWSEHRLELLQPCSISRPEWGLPTSVGSVAKFDMVKRALVAGNKRKREEQLSEDLVESGKGMRCD